MNHYEESKTYVNSVRTHRIHDTIAGEDLNDEKKQANQSIHYNGVIDVI